jgi:hypothetical protein
VVSRWAAIRFARRSSPSSMRTVVLISGDVSFGGEPRSRRVDGLGDPRLRLSWNLYGGPALEVRRILLEHLAAAPSVMPAEGAAEVRCTPGDGEDATPVAE